MNKEEYKNILAFHPGYYIKETIDEMELTQEEFAIRLGTTPKTVSKLVNGEINLSNEIAGKLAIMLGTSIDLWINMQARYEQKKIEIENEKFLNHQISYLNKIDYHFFEKLGLVKQTSDKKIKISELLRFLKIHSFDAFDREDLLVQFRTTSIAEEDTFDRVIINSWVQTVINIGHSIDTQTYSEKMLIQAIDDIKKMTLSENTDFISDLKDIMGKCGVALVVIPSLKKSKVYAAVKWINKDKVVLGITNRGQDADRFWFSLFHEIKHILQKQKNIIIDSDKTNELEHEANIYASETLVPIDLYTQFTNKFINKYFSEESVVEFANSIEVHPGIVVGRLQNDGLIAHSTLNKLKCKYNFN